MRKVWGYFFFGLFVCLTFAYAQEEDSMAYFKNLLTYSQPSSADIGGIVAPEILAVNHYPLFPKASEKIEIRATVISYASMVSYPVEEVILHFWKPGEEKKQKKMKLIDKVHGVYRATVSGMEAGEELFYTVSARDSWGNIAIELSPDGEMQQILGDDEDHFLPASLDIQSVSAAYSLDGLKLCLALRGKPKRNLGNEAGIYGIVVFSKDVRFKPFQVGGGELMSGWVAAYVPLLRVKDLISLSQISDLLSLSGKQETKARFSHSGNTICFAFSPSVVRQDFSLGLKVAGLTVTASVAPPAIKPKDATRMAMIYPVFHSFQVSEAPLRLPHK